MTKENSLVHNKDNSTRFFECENCNEDALSAGVKDGTAHLFCPLCGYDETTKVPVALTNPDGSASFVGNIPGGRGL